MVLYVVLSSAIRGSPKPGAGTLLFSRNLGGADGSVVLEMAIGRSLEYGGADGPVVLEIAVLSPPGFHSGSLSFLRALSAPLP